jgi:hypothetical protein
MIIGPWEDHPDSHKVVMSYEMPASFIPKWVVWSDTKREDAVFLSRFFNMQAWITENNLTAFMCSVTCCVVFMNDEDLTFFKLTWM